MAASASLAWSGTAGAVTSLKITKIVPSCSLHTVKFERTGTFASDEVVELWRTTGSAYKVKVLSVLGSPGTSMADNTFLPRSGELHTYHIVAKQPGGSTVTSNSASMTSSAARCGMPSVLRTSVLRVSCRTENNPNGNPLSVDINGPLFDNANPISVASYFSEVSNGLTSLENDEVISRVLPAGFACGQSFDGYRWSGLVPPATQVPIAELIAGLHADGVEPPDRWIVVFDRAYTGSAGVVVDGVPSIFIGGGYFRDYPGKGERGVLHELGHTYGAYHAGDLTCTNAPFPASHDVTTSCNPNPENAAFGAYSDYHDPMGTGGYHYSAFNKYLFGWIPDSDVTRVALSNISASSQTVTLYDAAWEYGPRLIKIWYNRVLRDPEYFFLEYRRASGFNAAGMLGDPTADGSYPVSASVYIRYFPTANLTCGKITPCITQDRHASTFLPTNNGPIKLIRMDQDPYWDPERKIRITMLSRSGRSTSLKIEREQ